MGQIIWQAHCQLYRFIVNCMGSKLIDLANDLASNFT